MAAEYSAAIFIEAIYKWHRSNDSLGVRRAVSVKLCRYPSWPVEYSDCQVEAHRAVSPIK
jgi:hypothetical protein